MSREEDIYKNKSRYEQFINNYKLLAIEPSKRKDKNAKKSKYWAKNKKNLEYFKKLFCVFDARDLSYVRRMRILGDFKLLIYLTPKDLKDCDRDEINYIVGQMRGTYNSSKSQIDFIKNLKVIWKILFPEKDEKGREDETLMPYVIRHISTKIDKSRQKLRPDALTWTEWEKLLQYFSKELNIQCFLAFIQDTLARPQESLYIKIKDVHIYDNYAEAYLSEHTKEGIGLCQVIDSYPYLIRWLEQHPLKNNTDEFFFVNGKDNKQLTPFTVNKKLKKACKELGIRKPVTCYTLKRVGVTFKILSGMSPSEIQHKARWSSLKQLQTYSQIDEKMTFRKELIRKGLIQPNKDDEGFINQTTKTCIFCQTINGFSDTACITCKRPLDREKLKKEMQEVQTIMENDVLKDLILQVAELQKEIRGMKED